MAGATPVVDAGPGFIEEIDSNELDLQTPVGKGSFGVVYKAIWRGYSVAVKTIESESERIAFVTELRQLSRVSHPNIICLYGACRNPVSLVMELAECGSLYTLLHGPGPQPHYTSGHGMSWCLQCANGVAYLHGMKPKALIHRDLKPPNLLLTNNGVVLKICDFGTACDQHTHMTNNKGSAAWMAPEVFEGSQYSEKCDVFSWGIILWEVLTRKKPFDDLGGPAFRIMWAVHTGARPNLIQGCPKPIEELMTSCWSPKPQQRPSMDEVVDAMNDLLNFFPGEATPLSFPSRDNESNSEVSSNYEVSITDSVIDSHMGTISSTVRKPHVQPVHPPTTPHVKSLVASSSASALSQRSQDLVSESRVRSRSHTPDPQRVHHDLSTAGVGKPGGRRRSSADDLIAELEKEPIVKTPVGSPSSPIMIRAMSHCGRNSPMPDPGPSTPSPARNAWVTPPHVPLINPAPVLADFNTQSQYHSSDSDSQCDSFPRAYVTLELHLQPLPPSTSSKESMEIYQQHCVLAEEYLRVSTEIALLKQRGEQLRIELEQDEKAKLEGNRLMLEYQQLVAENTSLQKWYDKMRKDLARVRENRQNQVWT